jgi:hypothetical protein
MTDDISPTLHADAPVHHGPLDPAQLNELKVGDLLWVPADILNPKQPLFCNDLRAGDAIMERIGTDLAQPPAFGLWERVR